MSGWTIYVDCKEPKAQELCNDLKTYSVNSKVGVLEDWFENEETEVPVDAQVQNLSCADYWCVKNGKVWAMIERKTLSDMDASIVQDLRYKDQAARMLKAKVPFTFYLIVGSLDSIDGPAQQRIISSLQHLQMEANLKVSYVPHSGHVLPYLVKTYQYLVSNPTPECITIPFVEKIQADCRKRKIDTPAVAYIAQLCAIYGVTEDSAKSIARVHGDMPTLIKAYEKCVDEVQRMRLLREIQVKKKKIGPILSERIYSCIMNVKLQNPTRKKIKVESDS